MMLIPCTIQFVPWALMFNPILQIWGYISQDTCKREKGGGPLGNITQLEYQEYIYDKSRNFIISIAHIYYIHVYDKYVCIFYVHSLQDTITNLKFIFMIILLNIYQT